MSRAPFDPSRMFGPGTGGGGAGGGTGTPGLWNHRRPGAEAPLTVSQLAVVINRALTECIQPSIRVVGEISQVRERTHWYFDLKDAGAVVSCVMFASAARRAGFIPRVGQQVVITGNVEFYDKGGRTQFMVSRMEPVGEGPLDAAFRRLCDDLRARGWFAEERKRPLPMFPRRVTVVTSRTGAALQDVLDTARRRCPAVPIDLVDVRVQGPGAAEQVAGAIDLLGRLHRQLGIDVILITRGGGSMEDLWAFNEPVVAEAIVNSPVPIVAAIGHETDTTIAELCADLRAATPTQAAMRIFPDGHALREQIDAMESKLSLLLRRQIRIERERLRGVSRHWFLADPSGLIDDRRDALRSHTRHLVSGARARVREAQARLHRAAARLEKHRPTTEYARRDAALCNAEARLRSAIAVRLKCLDVDGKGRRLATSLRTLLEQRAALLHSAARGLDLVGPVSVLRRGYSVTLHADGRIVRSSSEVLPGQTIATRLADGGFESTVRGPDGGPALPPPTRTARAAAAPRKPRSAADPRDQMDLFGPAR